MNLNIKLKEEELIKVLNYLQAEPRVQSNGDIVCRTVCHNGVGNGKHKLIYYQNSGLFVCYTGCSEEYFNVIKLIQKAKRTSESEAVSLLESLTGRFVNYITYEEGFDDSEEEDLDSLYLMNSNTNYNKEEKFEVKKFDKKLLNNFYDLYHISFVKDNIPVETMKVFGLKFDIEKNRIIIPHYYYKDNSLVAIRCRNLNKELLDLGLKYTPVKMRVKKGEKIKKMPIASKTSSYMYGAPTVWEAIKRHKIVILFEAEKSPMQMHGYYGDNSCAVATMGSFLSKKHIDILLELGVEEVVIAYDKEFEKYGDAEDKLYRKKLRKRLIEKLLPHFKTSLIYDKWGLLEYKDSPSDRGRETFEKLFSRRFYIKG